MHVRPNALLSACTTIVCIFACALHITPALAVVEAPITREADNSEVVEQIIGCVSAGREAVLFQERVECTNYREGWSYHRIRAPDFPLKVDADQTCSESEHRSKDWRRLSADAIKRIVNLTKSVDPHGIRSIGAAFCEQLDLAGLDLPYTLVIDRSLFRRGIELRNFRMRGDLSFDDSLILDELSIVRSHIGGSVYSSSAYIKQLRIMDSQIEGSLLFRNSMIPELAVFDAVLLSGELSVRGTALSYFLLQSSKLGGALDLTDSQARCAYLITKSEIGDFFAVNAGFGTSTSEQSAGGDKPYLFDWRPAHQSP